MQFSEIKGDCRFNGTLASDRAGRLYDSRFRDALRSTRRPLSEKEMRTVEAMTALRITARLTHGLMDRWADKHGLSEGRLHVLWALKAAPERQLTYARLTTAGAKRLEGLREQGLEWQLKIAAGLSTDELDQLRHACLQ